MVPQALNMWARLPAAQSRLHLLFCLLWHIYACWTRPSATITLQSCADVISVLSMYSGQGSPYPAWRAVVLIGFTHGRGIAATDQIPRPCSPGSCLWNQSWTTRKHDFTTFSRNPDKLLVTLTSGKTVVNPTTANREVILFASGLLDLGWWGYSHRSTEIWARSVRRVNIHFSVWKTTSKCKESPRACTEERGCKKHKGGRWR